MKIWIVITCVLGITASVSAHDPTEITYVFQKDELTIHLTPKGALDLMATIIPESSHKASINLRDYIPEYSSYFNRRIDLRSNGQKIELEFLNADLSKHDSWIQFRLSAADIPIHSLGIEITAFEDVYRNVQHIILANEVAIEQANLEPSYGYAGIIFVLGTLILLWPSRHDQKIGV